MLGSSTRQPRTPSSSEGGNPWVKSTVMGEEDKSCYNPNFYKHSKVVNGEITQDSNARVIRDGAIIFNGKIGSIFREKNQDKEVKNGHECGIAFKNFIDFKERDIIESYQVEKIEREI